MSKAYKWLKPGTPIRLEGGLDTKVISYPFRVRGVWVVTVKDVLPKPIGAPWPNMYEVACYNLDDQKPPPLPPKEK